jgi:hypothetical protein
MTISLKFSVLPALCAMVFTAGGLVAKPLVSNATQFARHDMIPMQLSQRGMRGGMDGMQPPGGMPGGMQQPNNRIDTDDSEREMMRMRGMPPGMSVGPGRVDLTDRIEGRIAFLRAELSITDAQAVTWNTFADSLRSARKHLVEARQALTQTTPSARLEQHERHLSERLQALKETRTAYQNLLAVLDDNQKRTAEELIVPFIATF